MTIKEYDNDDEARVWRIRVHQQGVTFKHEVLAIYYRLEDGFITFKDSAHKPVYAVAADSVLEITRLRTDVILAISRESLHDIQQALTLFADHLLHIDDNLVTRELYGDAEERARRRLRIDEQNEGLQRLYDLADERRIADPYSLPRTTLAP